MNQPRICPLEPVAAPPLPLNTEAHQLVLTVWCSRRGEFTVRAVLADGTRQDFTSPFELARFVAALMRTHPVPEAPRDSALPARGLR